MNNHIDELRETEKGFKKIKRIEKGTPNLQRNKN